MIPLPMRLVIGFAAGFMSHLFVESAIGALLHAARILPTLPWTFDPVPPFGVPKSVSLGFWAGLFGVAYVLLEPRLTARFGRWTGGALYALLGPLLADWFIVLPLKNMGIGGGFRFPAVPIDIVLNASLGVGTVAIFWLVTSLVERLALPSREARTGQVPSGRDALRPAAPNTERLGP